MRGRAIGLEVTGESGGEELVKCPFHDDRRASAWWNPKKDLFFCSVCGFGMGLEQLLKRTGNKIDSEMVYWDEEYDKAPVLDIASEVPRFDSGHPGYTHYLHDRGISAEVVADYGLQIGDPPIERVIFPCRDTLGKAHGSITRYEHSIAGRSRYIKHGQQYPIWPMEKLVGSIYGEYIIITEGLFSCLRIATADNRLKVFSTAGAKSNEGIVAAVSAFNPIFLYDRDLAGTRAAKDMKRRRPDWWVTTCSPAPDDIDDIDTVRNIVSSILKRINEGEY